MKKIQDLQEILSQLQPVLKSESYVFLSQQSHDAVPRTVAKITIEEPEGITFILEQTKVDELGLTYDFVAAWIILNVFSALAAVGLTAAVATALAKAEISCNVVAGYYHDHIFVDYDKRHEAMTILQQLSKSSQN